VLNEEQVAMPRIHRVGPDESKSALDAMRENGCVVIGNVLNRDWLLNYALAAQRFHSFLKELDLSQVDPRCAHLRGTKQFHMIQSGFNLSPILMFEMRMDWLPSSIVFLVRNSRLADVGRRYLGSSNCAFMLDACSVRVQPPDEPKRALSWHQDAYPASIRTPHDRGITFWVPLTDIDRFTPTLEVIPTQLDTIFATRTDESYYSVLQDEASVLSQLSIPPERLDDLRVGDVLMLDCFTLHRTVIPEGARATRMSSDIRLRALHSLSKDYAGHILA
jgi:hypothetical protein